LLGKIQNGACDMLFVFSRYRSMMKCFLSTLLISLVACVSIAQTPFAKLDDRLTWDKSKQDSRELIKRLENPLSSETRNKLRAKGSNSGGATRREYFYKPDYKGFYYSYFLFLGYGETGPHITTYKKGNSVGGYLDESEVLVQLYSDALMKELGYANLLAYTPEQLIANLGDNYLKKDSKLVYQHNNTLLIICYDAKPWFKISRVNKRFESFAELEQTDKLLDANMF
jgi:hypothetical protein